MNPSEIELGGKLGDPEVNVLRLRYDGKRQILGFRIACGILMFLTCLLWEGVAGSLQLHN